MNTTSNSKHSKKNGTSERTRIRELLKQTSHEYSVTLSELENMKEQMLKSEKLYKAKLEAQKWLQSIAQIVQQQVHDRISGVVSRCLEAVFDDPYEFKIFFEQKRGRTEARLAFVRNEQEYVPSDASGGGAIDVGAFALRLSCLVLTRPPLRRLLVLDEPFKNVNGVQYQERIGKMIEMITQELGVQIIMVTDDDWLKIGKVIEVTK